jgi:hypothetical protein
MVALPVQARGVASAAARVLLERKNQTNWSNRQLAESLGWSRNTADRYLHGERVMPLDAFYYSASCWNSTPPASCRSRPPRSLPQIAHRRPQLTYEALSLVSHLCSRDGARDADARDGFGAHEFGDQHSGTALAAMSPFVVRRGRE